MGDRMAPISLPERIETIDVVRGAALFGILASNMRAFNSPLAAYIDHSLMWQGPADRITQACIDLLISGKFITVFSFLFGLGFAVMMDRAEARGIDNRRFYLRRLSVLLIMGLVHLVFLWYGDILNAYALMGFILYGFRNSAPRKILLWGAVFYAWPLFVNGVTTAVGLLGVTIPAPPAPNAEQLQAIVRTYSTGTYAQIFAERMKENSFMLFALFFFYPRFLGVFLFGLWVWRKGIVRDLAAHRDLLRRCRNWGLAAGLPLNALTVALMEIYHPDPTGHEPVLFVINLAGAIGVPALSLFYMCAVALLFQQARWQPFLRPFAAVGRTALSNYLAQTIVCTTLFYSWGFGLYGKVGPLAGLIPTFLIYAALLAASAWWLRSFAFGPAEWVWRALTYGQVPAMRESAVSGKFSSPAARASRRSGR